MNIKLLRNLFLISMTNSHDFKTNNQIIFAELSLILAGNFDVANCKFASILLTCVCLHIAYSKDRRRTFKKDKKI